MNTRRDDGVCLTLVFVIVVFVFACTAAVFCGIGYHAMRKEAIEHGYAEWVVTDQNGNTKFEWKVKP